MSTRLGILDFRGPNGIWTKNSEAERNSYEAYDELSHNPKAHWEDILTSGSFSSSFEDVGKALPNPGQYALAELGGLGF